MGQSFFRNGRWVPHAQFLAMKEAEKKPVKTTASKTSKLDLATEEYVKLYKTEVPADHANDIAWIIKQNIFYEHTNSGNATKSDESIVSDTTK